LLDRQLRSLGDVKEQELTRLARAQRKQAPHCMLEFACFTCSAIVLSCSIFCSGFIAAGCVS
jgi:hypothetical protein